MLNWSFNIHSLRCLGILRPRLILMQVQDFGSLERIAVVVLSEHQPSPFALPFLCLPITVSVTGPQAVTVSGSPLLL